MPLSASFQKIDNKIFLEGEHQAAVVYLGQLALSDLMAAELALHAAVLINQVLQVEHSLFWELANDRQSLVLLAGPEDLESPAVLSPIAVDQSSTEGLAISSPSPILVEKSGAETIITSCDSNADPGVKHGLSLRIGTLEKPYGILQIVSGEGQYFSQNDL